MLWCDGHSDELWRQQLLAVLRGSWQWELYRRARLSDRSARVRRELLPERPCISCDPVKISYRDPDEGDDLYDDDRIGVWVHGMKMLLLFALVNSRCYR